MYTELVLLSQNGKTLYFTCWFFPFLPHNISLCVAIIIYSRATFFPQPCNRRQRGVCVLCVYIQTFKKKCTVTSLRYRQAWNFLHLFFITHFPVCYSIFGVKSISFYLMHTQMFIKILSPVKRSVVALGGWTV